MIEYYACEGRVIEIDSIFEYKLNKKVILKPDQTLRIIEPSHWLHLNKEGNVIDEGTLA